jgi:hypothetical protein
MIVALITGDNMKPENVDKLLNKYKKLMLEEMNKETQADVKDESNQEIQPNTTITDEMLKEQIMKGHMMLTSKKKILCFSCGSKLPDRFLNELKKDLMCPICFNNFSF